MAEIIGRVLPDKDEPRGPDAIHRVKVPQAWLAEGQQIELEVPRNLTCARCEGGGCDECERSGAITIRGREEPPELVQVTLPKLAGVEQGVGVSLRIAAHGGLALDRKLPRGVLLLKVTVAETPDDSVWLVSPPSEAAKPAALPSRKLMATSVVVVVFLIFLFIFPAQIFGLALT